MQNEDLKIPVPSHNYVINKNLENLLYDYKCDETKLQSMIDFISTITHITFDDLLYNMYEIMQTLLKENKDIVYKVVYNYKEIEGDKSAILKQSNLWISLFFYHSKLLKMKYSYNDDIFYNYKNKFIDNDISKFIVGYDVQVGGMDKCKIVKNNNNDTYDVFFYEDNAIIERIKSSVIRPIPNSNDDCVRNAEIDNLIIFDDMIYSGGQMLNKIIFLYLEEYIYTLKTIYVCVPFISDKFIKKISENFWMLKYKDDKVTIEDKLIKLTVIKEDPYYGEKKEIKIIFVFNEIIKSYLCLNNAIKPRIYFDHKLADIESIEIHRFQSNCPESDFYLIDGCNTVEKCPYPPYKKEKVENYLTPNQIKEKFNSFKKLTKKGIEDIKKCRNCGHEKIKKFLQSRQKSFKRKSLKRKSLKRKSLKRKSRKRKSL